MNPFQSTVISWDDPILYICSFLPGEDLLNLSEVDSMFNKIITGSKATMGKIRLVLDFKNYSHLKNVIKLAEKRPFTAIKLVGVNESFVHHVELNSLLNSLGSVEDIIIETCTFEENHLLKLLGTVLPKLKRCELKEVKLTNEEESNVTEPLERCDTNPLEHLKIEDSADGVLKFFVDCKQLKSFEQVEFVTEAEAVTNFLAQQTHLKKLEIFCSGFDWDRLACMQLEELATGYENWDDSPEELSKFLKKLPSLKKLEIFSWCRLSRRVMEVICRSPKLESLEWNVSSSDDVPVQDADALLVPDGFFNSTVKTLRIDDEVGITGCLLKIFRGVESVDLLFDFETLDLSDVPYESIEKIELENYDSDDEDDEDAEDFEPYNYPTFHVEFSPAAAPENAERFESVVLGFAKEGSARIHSIKIGNEAWLSNSGFHLSNFFCEHLINALPKVKALQLFNVADRESFKSFLTANCPDLTDFELHEPFDDDDFVKKLMNIELN